MVLSACYVGVLFTTGGSSMRPFASILLAAVLLHGCSGTETTAGGAGPAAAGGSKAAPQDIGEVIAKVNGQPIGSKEFEEAASRKTSASGGALTAEEKKEVADRLVDDVLLYEEALKRGLDKDPKVK